MVARAARASTATPSSRAVRNRATAMAMALALDAWIRPSAAGSATAGRARVLAWVTQAHCGQTGMFCELKTPEWVRIGCLWRACVT
ncbi:hypothetical protein GCM10022403_037510 [Streptomyces coacervatus]|uniref:Secreted protein n=1 Tax=Streptomyces coacervatus TaxID=647381 RepID=A0ABP7HQA4_9ACTN